MAWIAVSMKYVSFIVSDDISALTFFKLISFILPDIAGTVFSICLLISSIIVLHKMQVDNELVTLMTLGKSAISILRPLLAFAACISCSIFFLQAKISPYSYRHFFDIQEKIRNQVSTSIIKPGIFNVLGDSVVYVGKKRGATVCDVFISYVPAEEKSNVNIITAKSGTYSVQGENLFIILENGCKQELDRNNLIISTLNFDSFAYDITPFFYRFKLAQTNERNCTQGELLSLAGETNDSRWRNIYIAEYFSRLTTPCIPIVTMMFVAFFMIRPRGRNKKKSDIIKSFFSGITGQIMISTLIHASTKNNDVIIFNYIIIFSIILFTFYLLSRGKLA
jgi:lipopolysaccharide export LptBFGC system permease protein LptF